MCLSQVYALHNKFNLNLVKNNKSSYENEIKCWLESNAIEAQFNNRSIISPKEVDIFIKKYNLAIEFNGLYWHSELNGKDKHYHANKTKLAKDKSVRLVHIFEDEWVNKKEVCLDILSRILGINQTKIMARKCSIKELSNMKVKDFLMNNHLQGYTSASLNLGLFYENELIQLITLKHSRFNKKIEWEIIRQVNKKGIQVTGGLQKLWSYFIKKYSPKSVISYCDLRWFLGESYNKLGFKMINTTRPQYAYTDFVNRWHRLKFTKKQCRKLLGEELNNKTERQMTERLGLEKIWDCGHQVWIYQPFSTI